MKRVLISILFIFGSISVSIGQDVKVTSAFDTSRILIGDQIEFTITVDKPADLRLALPVFKDSLCKNIEIISGPVSDSSSIYDGRVKIIEKYLITSFDSGYYQIPPVFAELKNENGLKRFYSDYSQLEVLRVDIMPADTTAKIYDIIKPYRAPLTLGEVLPWGLIMAVVLLIAWAVVKFIRKIKRPGTTIEEVLNPDPAHIVAFRELEKLREEELWQKNEIKAYYTRLTEILRQYLENRYGVFSLELTTSETLDALHKAGFKKDTTYNQLKTILVGADLVKFAKYNPEPTEHDSHFQNAWDFVFTTKAMVEINETVKVNNKDMEGSV